MIIAGSSGSAAALPFTLALTATGAPVTGKVWTNVGGGVTDELKVRLPGGAFADAAISRIVELGGGAYEYRLTDAETASPGKVYYYPNVVGVDGDQLTARYEDILVGFFSSSPSTPPSSGGSGSGYLVSDLIEEARVLLADDNTEDAGWIDTKHWIRWLNWEVQAIARRAANMGVVRGPITDTVITGPSATVTGCLRLLAVYDEDGLELTKLQPDEVNPLLSADWQGASNAYVVYSQGGDNWTVELTPRDTRQYTVRYIPQPAYVTADNQYVLLPQGFERRVVYGMVLHGMMKEGGASAALERQILRADAEIGLSLFGQGIGPKVRINRRPLEWPFRLPRGPGRFR